MESLKKPKPARYQPTGTASLIGLTLLECGVKPNDPAVQQRAEEVRKAAVDLNHTYSLALAILFLDRLGDPGDSPFVLSMGVRLLAGQNQSGGWSYNCPAPPEAEVKRLQSLVGQRSEQVQVQQYTGAQPDPLKAPPPLPPEIRDLIRNIRQPQGDSSMFGLGDNSNTQFAILGLWAARRHGLPVQITLARAAERFRRSQNSDGGWGYLPNRSGGDSTGAMTCVGLLGLALHMGTANEAVLRTNPKTPLTRLPRDPERDQSARLGLLALGTSIGGNPKDAAAKGPVKLNKGYYFLWSVERVAVANGLKTIAGKDWYRWGSTILVDSQRADGSWQGEYGAEVDTCFALLFLRRANVAPDLTFFLKGRIEDPGEIILKSGGVGGEALAKRNLPGVVWSPTRESVAELPEVTKLKQELIQARPDEQPKLIERLKTEKGSLHTLALAAAIPQLVDPTRTQARDALAERLTRMTAATLRDKLQEADAELRRAAALACAMKEDKGHVPDLVGLLDDFEVSVVRASLVGLKHLTGQDLGSHAKPEERAQTVGAWKEWWRKQEK